VGVISCSALRGQLSRTDADKAYALNISYSFLCMFIGLIDGDGYIAIIKAHQRDNITIRLVLSLEQKELPMLEYLQSVLKIGSITQYPKINKVKFIINRTDLQEIVFPLMNHHHLFFLTLTRPLQYNKAIYVLTQPISQFSKIPEVIPVAPGVVAELTASEYLLLDFFNH